MEIIGELQNLSLDFATGKPIVSFECEDKRVLADVEGLKGKKLSLVLKPFRKKRSLDQNAYFHKLCGLLADALKVSKPYTKNFLLNRYGQLDTLNDKLIQFILPDELFDEIAEWDTIHLRPTSHTMTMENGKLYRLYYKIKNSREMNTEEFSNLIDGTIAECKDVGIPTDTPEEIARLKALWAQASLTRAKAATNAVDGE